MDKVEPHSDDESSIVDYLRGLVYYCIGDTKKAQQLFLASANISKKIECKYMVMKCLLKENNILVSRWHISLICRLCCYDVEWGIKLLMSLGIDYYDANELLALCNDLSLLPRVSNFEQGLDSIDKRAAQLNLETEYRNTMRRHWVGGEFRTTIGGTISTAIKGSVAAGIMNAGSGVLHGIGNSIVKAINNSEIIRQVSNFAMLLLQLAMTLVTSLGLLLRRLMA